MKLFKPKFWDKNKISLFSILLIPITLLIKLLNFFRITLTKSKKYSIPIICVGNIYLGGTGKTPLCIEIFSILKNLNMEPSFIRKKYKLFQDEVSLQENFGNVYQSKKRSDAIKKAIINKTNVAILDDGFQDFSVKKDLSIICFNEKQWLGNGFTIPSGPLREDLSALKRANCIVINGTKNTSIEKKILSHNKELKIFYMKYKATNIEQLKNKEVIAFAGIGNPVNFFNLLEENNIKILEKIKFPDHYNYSEKELDDLINKVVSNNVVLVTTEKDYLRINEKYKNNIQFLKIKVEIENQTQFIEEIKKII